MNATRFLNQFTVGYGDYMEEREELFGHLTMDELINDIKREQERPETDSEKFYLGCKRVNEKRPSSRGSFLFLSEKANGRFPITSRHTNQPTDNGRSPDDMGA
ncbi:MAG: hypothetical protein M5U34_26400 [Chloroflexi bacterium]|nr:hypothetical protein [Chloroflexota bacterium]